MSQTNGNIYNFDNGLEELTLIYYVKMKSTHSINLHIQGKTYENAKAFHRNRINNSKICMKTQNTPINQNDLKKKN